MFTNVTVSTRNVESQSGPEDACDGSTAVLCDRWRGAPWNATNATRTTRLYPYHVNSAVLFLLIIVRAFILHILKIKLLVLTIERD